MAILRKNPELISVAFVNKWITPEIIRRSFELYPDTLVNSLAQNIYLPEQVFSEFLPYFDYFSTKDFLRNPSISPKFYLDHWSQFLEIFRVDVNPAKKIVDQLLHNK